MKLQNVNENLTGTEIQSKKFVVLHAVFKLSKKKLSLEDMSLSYLFKTARRRVEKYSE